MTSKICFTCRESKPLTSFWKHIIQKDGHNHICKACRSTQKKAEYAQKAEMIRAQTKKRYANDEDFRERKKAKAKAWHAKNKNRKKNQDLIKNFGLTLQEYNAMFANQNGCCAICQRHQRDFKRALATDHDHGSGKVRSLLCGPCNSALGHMQDDPSRLEKAAVYIRRHKMRLITCESKS